jgi:hypothetical protein
MPRNKDLLLQMMADSVNKGASIGASGAEQRMGHQNLLDQLSHKKELDNAGRAEEAAAAQGLYGKYKGKASIKYGDVTLNPESAASLRPVLTPAQEAAEKAAGKQVEDYTAAGGRPAFEKNVQSLDEASADLQGGAGKEPKRDTYDRWVGGATSGFPTVMGLLAPTEKARRDKVRNTALELVKKTDPNPTEKQVESMMGQIYDPSSDNASNLERVNKFKTQQRQTMQQREQAAANYRKTGYVTLGAGAPSPTSPASGAGIDPRRQRLLELRAKKAQKGGF